MKRLSKYERLLLLFAAVVVLIGCISILASMEILFRVSILLLSGLIVATTVLVMFRLDRIADQQTRTRQELYQVLYWLHGSDKLTVQEAQKTRRHFRQSPRGTGEGTPPNEITNLIKHNSKKTDACYESQRLQFNRLFAVLDAHWQLLAEKKD